MPVILDADSKDFRKWLHPPRRRWANDLQSLLKPYEGDLDIYPVSKDVGKVGRSSPSFIRPLNDKGKEHDIARFFKNNPETPDTEKEKPEVAGKVEKYESKDNQPVGQADARPKLSKGADVHKKHKIPGDYNPPTKRSRIKPGPAGVQKITDFFG